MMSSPSSAPTPAVDTDDDDDYYTTTTTTSFSPDGCLVCIPGASNLSVPENESCICTELMDVLKKQVILASLTYTMATTCFGTCPRSACAAPFGSPATASSWPPTSSASLSAPSATCWCWWLRHAAAAARRGDPSSTGAPPRSCRDRWRWVASSVLHRPRIRHLSMPFIEVPPTANTDINTYCLLPSVGGSPPGDGGGSSRPAAPLLPQLAPFRRRRTRLPVGRVHAHAGHHGLCSQPGRRHRGQVCRCRPPPQVQGCLQQDQLQAVPLHHLGALGAARDSHCVYKGEEEDV